MNLHFRVHSYQIVDLALVDKVLPLLGVLDDVPRHPRREEPPGHELGEPVEGQVGEEASVGEVVLVPVVGVHFLLLVLRLLVVQKELGREDNLQSYSSRLYL